MKDVKYLNGHITQASSDSGRISVLQTPLTPCFGNYDLRDNTTGQQIWRGLYPDADGKFSDKKVPVDLWAEAVALTHEIDEIIRAEDEASSKRSMDYWASRESPVAARLTAEMNHPDSDL